MTDFLRDLWQYKPEDGHILLWSLRDGRSSFYTEVEQAIVASEALGKAGDVYVGVGLRPIAFPPDKRGGNDDVSAIAALWLDVDIKDPVHDKQNLFDSEQDAIAFIEKTTPLRASYIIHTGHGLQAWWLLKEVWELETPTDRRNAADLSRRWTNTFRFAAHEIGLDIDALHDLSRVFRIPGTFNHKDVKSGGKPLRVQILSSYGHGDSIQRYSPEEFEPYLRETPIEESQQVVDVGEYVVNLDADPPFAKFELLQDANPKFRQSWLHKRKDLGDQSLSAYDQSLASIAARTGWTPQEIVDLIIAHRRKHGESDNHKKNLPDYLTRTLRKAMAGAKNEVQQSAAIEEIQRAETPTERLDGLARLFSGVRIDKIVKYMSDPPTYQLHTESGSVSLGQITGLVNFNTFSAHVANATRRMIPRMKEDRWREAVQAMLNCLEEQSAGEESTDTGMVRGWLSAYLADKAPTNSLEDAARTLSTFRLEGATYVFGQGLRRWLNTNYGERVDGKQMGLYLRSFGCEPAIKNMPVRGNKRTTRYCWKLPIAESFIEDFEE